MALFDRFRKKADVTKPPTGAEIGRSGTINSGGFISDQETNQALRHPNNLAVYDEMRRTDATIRWILALIKYPILSAHWMVEPPEDPDDQELEACAFIENWKDEQLAGGWFNFLRHALMVEEYGHMAFELVAELRPVEFQWQSDDETPHDVSRDAFVISKLAPRLPRTLIQWNVDDKDPSKLISVTQWLGDGRGPSNPTIPAEQLVLFTREQEGDDFRGVSILRAAYKPWRYKLELENLEAMAIERSVGLPVAYVPGATDNEQDDLEEAFTALRQQENPFLIIPKAKWSTSNPDGWIVDFPQLNAEGGVSANDAIARHEAALARNVLAEWMRLGHEGEGARATADVQQDPYWQGIEAEVRFLEGVINEQIVPKLVAWNYDVKRLPKLKAAKIQAKNVQVIAKAVGELVTAGALIPDATMEDWIRDILDAPESKREGEDPFAKLLEQKLNPPQPPQIGPDGKPVPPKPPGDNPPGDKPPAPKPGAKPPSPAAKLRDTTGEQAFADMALPLSRVLRPAEHHVAFADIVDTLDSGEQRIADACTQLAPVVLAPGIKAAEAAVAHKSPDAVEALPIDPTPLADAIFGVLKSVYDNGQTQVAAEIARQSPTKMADAPPPPPEIERLKRLRALADTVASSVSAAAMRTLRTLTLRQIEHPDQTPTGPGFDPVQTLTAEAKRAGRPTVGQAFADGRRDALLANQDNLDSMVYSALLDDSGCEECANADGTEIAAGEQMDPEVPNPDCAGGANCRCMWVPVVSADRSGLEPDIGPNYVVQNETPAAKDASVRLVVEQGLPAEQLELLKQLADGVNRPLPAPIVNVEAAPAPIINVQAPEVHIEPPVVNVQVPEQAPVSVELGDLPEALVKMADRAGQQAPSDIADALRELAAAIKAPRTKRIVADAQGRPQEIRESAG